MLIGHPFIAHQLNNKSNLLLSSSVGQYMTPLSRKAQRRAFETPTEQIALLSGGTWDEQVASLRETMQEMEDQPGEFKVLVQAWVDGDLKALDHEALDPVRKA
ncbi:MAG: TraB/GumN family protein, partial [Ktedonobacteraceae bacterium]